MEWERVSVPALVPVVQQLAVELVPESARASVPVPVSDLVVQQLVVGLALELVPELERVSDPVLKELALELAQVQD